MILPLPSFATSTSTVLVEIIKTIFGDGLKQLTALLQRVNLAVSEGTSMMDYIIHHVTDQNSWHPLPLVPLTFKFPNFLIFEGLKFQNGLHALMLVFAAIFLFILFAVLYRKNANAAPKGLTNALEVLVLFVRNDIAIEHLGEKDGRKFAPFFLTMFFFILMLNLMGLIPVLSTATANVNITAAFAAITLVMMVVLGLKRNGPFGFLKIFVPAGIPIPIIPLIFTLEFAGLLIKPFALTIRLFANMLAGHIVVLAIIGVAVDFGVTGLPLLLLALFIYFLEIMVAFLQAYVFTMLSALFLGEILHPNH